MYHGKLAFNIVDPILRNETRLNIEKAKAAKFCSTAVIPNPKARLLAVPSPTTAD